MLARIIRLYRTVASDPKAVSSSTTRFLSSLSATGRTETSSISGRNQTVVSKSAAKALAGLVSLSKIRMISRFLSAGELNLDSFVTDLDTSGFPGARSVPGAAGGSCLRRGFFFCGLPIMA